MYQKGNKKTHLQQGALFRRQDFASVLPRLELLSLKDQKLRWIILSTLLLLLFLLVNRGAIYRILNIEAGTRTVNFSGKIVNKADGTNLVTGTPSCVAAGADTCDFRVRIYDAASAGNLLFEEEHTDIEIGDTDGVFTLDINSICNSAASGSSDWGTTACVSNGGVDFSSANVFVELAFDPTGAGSYTEVFARKQLSNTGSAFYAERAGNLDTGFTSGSIVFEGSSGIAEDNSNLYWDDSSNFLGVGVNDPGYEIDVDGGIFLRSQGIDNKSGQISFQATTTAAGDRIGYIRQDGTDGINSQLQIGTSGYIGFVLDSNTVSILHNNGLTIGTTTVGSNTLSLYQSTNNEALLIQAPNITSKPAFSLQNLPASTDVNTGKAFEIKVTGEGFGRGQFYSDGGYGIGGGSATRDIFISRAAANRLIVSSNKSTGAADLTVTRGIRAGSSAAPFAYLDAEAGTTTYPSLRIRSGVATTSPNAGEIYSDGTDLFFYNGSGWDDLTATGTSYWTQSGSDIYYDTGKVTVGTTSSRSLLNVETGTPTYPSILTDNDVLFADSGNIIMTMIAGTTSSSIINFGDSGDEDIGKITYSHVANSLTFTTNAAGRLAINSSGGVTVYGLAGGGSQCLQVDNTGLIGVTGSACGSGSSLFTDGGATTYLTATGDNLAIGSSSTATNEKLLVYSTDADVKLKIASSTVGYPGFILEDSTIAWRFTKNSNDFVIKTSAVAQGIFKINKSSPDYALVIDVDGDVGIGTDSALAKLHVVGGARITDLSGGGTQCVQVDNNGDLSGSGAGCGGGSSLFTDGGATTYLTATGDNLAIGTSSAESKATILSSGLDAADDSALGQYGLTINDQTNTAGLEVGIGFRISSSLGSTDRPGAAITHERTGSSSIGTLNFKTASVANTITTRMTIDEDGDVIITKLAGGGTQCLQVDNTGLISGTAASCGGGASLWTDGGATTYLTATGDNVGIGTTSAQAKIHAQTSASANMLMFENTGGTADKRAFGFYNYYGGTSSSNLLVLRAYNNSYSVVRDLMTFNHDGAVSMQGQMGIGTTTPQYPLDLRSTTATILQNNSLTNSGASAVTGIYNNVYSTNTSGTKSTATGVESLVTQTGAGGTITDAYGVRGRVEGNAGTINNAYGLYATVTAPSGTINNAYGLYVDTVEETGTGSAYGIYVKDSQSYFGNNVGIGTTTPSSMVHIYGNSAASSRLTLTRSDVDSDEMYMGMVSRGGIKMLDIGGATTATIAATFTEDGSVGIGTTNPYSKLEIKDGSVYLSDSDVSQPITGAWPATTYGFLTPINGTAGGLWLTGLSDTDATATRISGIMGTNNPTDSVPAVSFTASKYNTSVSTQALGNTETAFQFTNESSVITTIYGNGNMTIGGSLTQNSDERLKTNIQNLTDGVSILNQIRPVSYILKKTDENNYGVIAQEVEKILPELVLTSPADGIKSVNYIGFIPFLIKATQEQQSSINILQNDINKLKAQIASISGTPSGTTPLEFSEYLEVVSLKVTGLVDFGENTVGIATVPAGETEIAIEFTESYTTPPIITVTPEGQEYLDSGLTYTIIDKTEDGFTIKLSDIYTEDLLFNWHVFE